MKEEHVRFEKARRGHSLNRLVEKGNPLSIHTVKQAHHPLDTHVSLPSPSFSYFLSQPLILVLHLFPVSCLYKSTTWRFEFYHPPPCPSLLHCLTYNSTLS